MKPALIAGIAAFLALGSVAAPAQSAIPVKQGAIAYLEGVVYADGQRVEPSAVPFSINPNSVVKTENGRAEVVLSKGGNLYLGENSSVRQLDSGVYNFSRVAILSGSAVLVTGESGSLVDCEDAAKLSDSGVYRFDLQAVAQPTENVCRLRIYAGAAAVQLPTVISVLTPGKSMGLNRRAGDMIPRQEFSTTDTDALDRWSRQRIQLHRP